MITSVLLVMLLAGLSEAQVQVKGRFRETVLALQKAAFTSDSPLYQPVEKVSNILLQTEEMFQQAMVTKPYKFAESLEMPLDIKKDGHWQDTRALDGTPIKIWRAIVSSDDALSLSLQFDEFHLPDGVEFYIFGRESFMGAFTGHVNNKPDGSFSTVPIAGDFLGLEVVVPADKSQDQFQKMLREDLKMKLGKIAHGFRNFPKSFHDSGACNIDVACETSAKYEKQIKSTAMIITRDGTRFCTGTMINNTKMNRRQLFLTANHCLFTSAYNFVAVFNYQNLNCGGFGPEPSLIQSAHGMKLLATYPPSDFALLELTEAIPDSYDVYLAGWDVSINAPSNVFGIHHPSGDVKKISFYDGTTLASSWTEFPKKLHWMIPKWTRGTTEPGSSGSALFNSDGLVVGHLHGGQASCSNPEGYDMYGGLTHDWNGGGVPTRRLRDHLNPSGVPVTSLQGMWMRQNRKREKIEVDETASSNVPDKLEDGFIDDLYGWIGEVVRPWFGQEAVVNGNTDGNHQQDAQVYATPSAEEDDEGAESQSFDGPLQHVPLDALISSRKARLFVS